MTQARQTIFHNLGLPEALPELGAPAPGGNWLHGECETCHGNGCDPEAPCTCPAHDCVCVLCRRAGHETYLERHQRRTIKPRTTKEAGQ